MPPLVKTTSLGPGAVGLGDQLPGLLDHPPGPAAWIVQRRGVAELGQFLGHRRQGRGQHRRRGRVVKVHRSTRGRTGIRHAGWARLHRYLT